jgi:hypothetical protein
MCKEEHILIIFIYRSNANNTVLNTNKNIEGFHSNKHKCCQLRRHEDDMITNPTG